MQTLVTEGKGTKEDFDQLLQSEKMRGHRYLLVWSEFWTTQSGEWAIRGTDQIEEAISGKQTESWQRREKIYDPRAGKFLTPVEAVKAHLATLKDEERQQLLEDLLARDFLAQLEKKSSVTRSR